VELGERRILFCIGSHGESEEEKDVMFCCRWDVDGEGFDSRRKAKQRKKGTIFIFFFLLESGLVMAVWRQWNGLILKATRMDRLPALTP